MPALTEIIEEIEKAQKNEGTSEVCVTLDNSSNGAAYCMHTNGNGEVRRSLKLESFHSASGAPEMHLGTEVANEGVFAKKEIVRALDEVASEFKTVITDKGGNRHAVYIEHFGFRGVAELSHYASFKKNEEGSNVLTVRFHLALNGVSPRYLARFEELLSTLKGCKVEFESLSEVTFTFNENGALIGGNVYVDEGISIYGGPRCSAKKSNQSTTIHKNDGITAEYTAQKALQKTCFHSHGHKSRACISRNKSLGKPSSIIGVSARSLSSQDGALFSALNAQLYRLPPPSSNASARIIAGLSYFSSAATRLHGVVSGPESNAYNLKLPPPDNSSLPQATTSASRIPHVSQSYDMLGTIVAALITVGVVFSASVIAYLLLKRQHEKNRSQGKH